jgi:hypothetical protein
MARVINFIGLNSFVFFTLIFLPKYKIAKIENNKIWNLNKK